MILKFVSLNIMNEKTIDTGSSLHCDKNNLLFKNDCINAEDKKKIDLEPDDIFASIEKDRKNYSHYDTEKLKCLSNINSLEKESIEGIYSVGDGKQNVISELLSNNIIDTCPVCLKKNNYEQPISFIVHLKSCATKSRISTDQLIKAIELQQKQVTERVALGLPAGLKAKVSNKKKYSKKKYGDSNLELAVALSVSLRESEMMNKMKETETLLEAGLEQEALSQCKHLEDYGFMISKPFETESVKRKANQNTVLFTRSKEEREQIITEKIGIILVDFDTDSINVIHKTESSNICLRSKFLKKFRDKETTLWNKSYQLKDELDFENYYVGNLSRFISPCTTRVGSKLKHLSQIPCRPLSPKKRIIQNNHEADIVTDHFIPKQNEFKRSNSNVFTDIKFCEDWKCMVNEKFMSDVTIYTKKEESIFAHKLVFYVRCRQILSDIIKETTNNQTSFIIMWMDFDYEAAITFLEYIYSGSIRKLNLLTDYQLKDLIVLCSRYSFEKLKEVIVNFSMNRTLSSSVESYGFICEANEPCETNIFSNSDRPYLRDCFSSCDSDSYHCDRDVKLPKSVCSRDNVNSESLKEFGNLNVKNKIRSYSYEKDDVMFSSDEDSSSVSLHTLHRINNEFKETVVLDDICTEINDNTSVMKRKSSPLQNIVYKKTKNDFSVIENQSEVNIDCVNISKTSSSCEKGTIIINDTDDTGKANHNVSYKFNLGSYVTYDEIENEVDGFRNLLPEQEKCSTNISKKCESEYTSKDQQMLMNKLNMSISDSKNNRDIENISSSSSLNLSSSSHEVLLKGNSHDEKNSLSYISPIWDGFAEINNDYFDCYPLDSSNSSKNLNEGDEICIDNYSPFKKSNKFVQHEIPLIHSRLKDCKFDQEHSISLENNKVKNICKVDDYNVSSNEIFFESLSIDEEFINKLESKIVSPSYERNTISVQNKTPTNIRKFHCRSKSDTCITPKSGPNPQHVTPMADYSSMKPKELKKELDKYGLKPGISKNKAKQLLRYIYNQLHPYSDEIIDDHSVCRRETSIEKIDALNRPDKVNINTNKKLIKKTENCSLSDSNNSSETEQSDINLFEESITDSKDTDDGNSENKVSRLAALDVAFRDLLQEDTQLHEKILLYEPLWLESIKNTLKEKGVKCNNRELMDYLDEKCVTFRTHRNNHKRPRRKKRVKSTRNEEISDEITNFRSTQ